MDDLNEIERLDIENMLNIQLNQIIINIINLTNN
jgi:hypothetical protein